MTVSKPVKDLRNTEIRRNKIRESALSDRIFGAVVLILSILCFLIILYPLWFVVIASISNSDLVNQGKVTFLPVDIRFYGYQQVFSDSRIWNGYMNTIIYVVAGTALNLAVTMPAAYALSRPDFRARNVVMTYFVFTMYFSGGLVPLYMTISNLGLISTKLILIIFVAVNTYNLIIARTFIQNSIPNDLYEAAILDGCDHFTYFWKVVLPLSKAVISVEILYYGVFHWNDYFNALVYNYKQSNEPLQMVLRRILLLNEAYASGNGGVQGGYGQSSADQVKYAVMIVSTVPILCVYPFVQKYFEKGVMIGAVKG
ncbi:MAG: carbohydrate ABC transporter permease [Clostridia bacterium]|nr:carbohydrate ABC transporter permease [Clostridia bacterium]